MMQFEENIRLVKTITNKLVGWAASVNVGMDYDDVYQEVSLAFWLAAKNFDSSKGVTFSTYFSMIAKNQLQRTLGRLTGVKNLTDEDREYLAKIEEENKQLLAEGKEPKSTYLGLSIVSYDQPQDEESTGGADMFESGWNKPDQIAESKDEVMKILAKLPAPANLLIDIMLNPPKDINFPLFGKYPTLSEACEYLLRQGKHSTFQVRMARKNILEAASSL